MKLALTLTTVEAETEEAVGTDAAEGATNEKGHIRYEHLPLQTKAGHDIYVEVLSNTYWVNHNRLIQFNIRDIEERRAAEIVRLKIEGRLIRAKKMEAIASLAGGMAHQFNNALFVIAANFNLLEANAPKLAILDWMMPERDGAEVCRRIRKIKTSIPTYIILLTALGSKKDIIKGFEVGADDYVVKPFDNDELQARIKAGHRIIELQTALAEKEKLQDVMEMAGAVCHELNQPLQSISIYSEILMMDIDKKNPTYEKIKEIKGQVDRMGEITKKLMHITKYETKGYLRGQIIDIDKASKQ